MPINDTLKAKIDDLDLDRRLDELTSVTHKALQDAKAQLGSLAHDNRAKVDEWLHKATDGLDARTDGKYRDKIAKFSASVEGLVDKVAAQRPQPADAGAASPGPQDSLSAFDDEADMIAEGAPVADPRHETH